MVVSCYIYLGFDLTVIGAVRTWYCDGLRVSRWWFSYVSLGSGPSVRTFWWRCNPFAISFWWELLTIAGHDAVCETCFAFGLQFVLSAVPNDDPWFVLCFVEWMLLLHIIMWANSLVSCVSRYLPVYSHSVIAISLIVFLVVFVWDVFSSSVGVCSSLWLLHPHLFVWVCHRVAHL